MESLQPNPKAAEVNAIKEANGSLNIISLQHLRTMGEEGKCII
jgi:hypothetical protein